MSESSELDTLDKKVSTNMNIYMNIHLYLINVYNR